MRKVTALVYKTGPVIARVRSQEICHGITRGEPRAHFLVTDLDLGCRDRG